MSRIRLLAVAAVAALGPPGDALAAELYFMTVYGAERPIINRPCHTHTWATFIQLSGEGADPRSYRAQSFTISWLPQSLDVRPFHFRAEPGVNLDLNDTIAWCGRNHMKIAQFGPYQITPELWARAGKRLDQLEGAELLYRASDLINAPRFQKACNCIYAVLDNDNRDPAIRLVTLGFGDLGSAFVARRLSSQIIDRRQTHPWVSEMIGVCNYEAAGIAVLLGP